MTDQEKIEAEASELWERIRTGDIFPIPHAKSVFKAGVAWRDRNPSPEVEAIVHWVKDLVELNGLSEESELHHALAAYEKARGEG